MMGIMDEWVKGTAEIIGLRVGDKIARRGGGVAHVRAVLPDDEVAVVRMWLRRKQRRDYVVIDPADFLTGLWMRVPRRKARS